MSLVTKSGAQVFTGEPMTGGYATHNGKGVRHISDDFGSTNAVCGKKLRYTVQLSKLEEATCRTCRTSCGM